MDGRVPAAELHDKRMLPPLVSLRLEIDDDR